jgi:hypothetical protein
MFPWDPFKGLVVPPDQLDFLDEQGRANLALQLLQRRAQPPAHRELLQRARRTPPHSPSSRAVAWSMATWDLPKDELTSEGCRA